MDTFDPLWDILVPGSRCPHSNWGLVGVSCPVVSVSAQTLYPALGRSDSRFSSGW